MLSVKTRAEWDRKTGSAPGAHLEAREEDGDDCGRRLLRRPELMHDPRSGDGRRRHRVAPLRRHIDLRGAYSSRCQDVGSYRRSAKRVRTLQHNRCMSAFSDL